MFQDVTLLSPAGFALETNLDRAIRRTRETLAAHSATSHRRATNAAMLLGRASKLNLDYENKCGVLVMTALHFPKDVSLPRLRAEAHSLRLQRDVLRAVAAELRDYERNPLMEGQS